MAQASDLQENLSEINVNTEGKRTKVNNNVAYQEKKLFPKACNRNSKKDNNGDIY
jgi:hypothetical protein